MSEQSTKRYTKNGEWVRRVGSTWQVGLSASAVDELGDVNFVEAPVLGRVVTAGEAVLTVEAVKAAADYYSPVGGRIAAVNSELLAKPELMNSSPEDLAWIFSLEGVSETELDSLLDVAAWEKWETGR